MYVYTSVFVCVFLYVFFVCVFYLSFCSYLSSSSNNVLCMPGLVCLQKKYVVIYMCVFLYKCLLFIYIYIHTYIHTHIYMWGWFSVL